VYEEDLEMAKDKFRQAMKTDAAYIREYRMKAKNGRIVWVEEGSQIIYGENGEVEFITGAFLDITERKQAEQALHESEEKYRSLFDSGPTPIFVIDRNTNRILDANPMAQETYGYTKQDLVDRAFTDLGPVDDVYKRLPSFNGNDWPKACVANSKIRHFKKGNKPFYVRVTACPIRYRNRNAVILAITDITETMEKEAQLLQASKMTTLGEMSAGIAHELNQPLNAIKMGNEFIKMMIAKNSRISEKDLLKVSSNVSKVLVQLEKNLPPVLANNNRLEQVFFNLITNARDAINQKKEAGLQTGEDVITIRTYGDKDRVAITVSDTGIGMSSDIRDKIFEPFYTTKEVGKGMGLGLYITYGIVKSYGGEIKIISEEAKGSTFKLTFPCDAL
jgi:PAS domain S-box-containing protein